MFQFLLLLISLARDQWKALSFPCPAASPASFGVRAGRGVWGQWGVYGGMEKKAPSSQFTAGSGTGFCPGHNYKTTNNVCGEGS